MSELQILSLMMPIFLPVAAGWLIVRINLLDASNADVLSTLFLYVFAPPLIIVYLAKEDLASLIEPRLIVATVFLMLGLYGGLFMVHFVLLRRGLHVSAFAAFAGTKFNAIVIGFPVLFATVRHHAIVTMTINVVIGYFTILPLTLILANISRSGGISGAAAGKMILSAVRKAITHPLVVTTILGLFLAGTAIHLPKWLDITLRTLGEAAIPTALLGVGMSLSALSIGTNVADIVWMSAARMILSPVLAIFVAKLFELSSVFAIALVVSFSLPTAKMVLPLAIEHKTYVKQSAGIIALTTASLVAVWPVVIWTCERLWPGIVGGLG